MARIGFLFVLAALVSLPSCDGRRLAPATAPSPAGESGASGPAPLDGGGLTVQGPFSHENLAVFLVCSAHPGSGEFITLDEGLRTGSVTVSEKESEQVHELVIENSSDTPLFLQEGDRVKGGKQDRIVATSLVIQPHSGKTALPSFCVEQHRWTAGARGKAFASTENACLAPKSIRQAAKMAGSQQAVWDDVNATKAACGAAFETTSRNSSLNEALDSPQVIAISKAHETALAGILKEHPDAVGAAFVVNGRIEEVSVYPSTFLLKKLYPRLVESYAVQAALEKDRAGGAKPVAAADVAQFMKQGGEKSRRDKKINSENAVCLVEFEEKVSCDTTYNGQSVHKQWMTRDKDLPIDVQGQDRTRPQTEINREPQQLENERQDR